MGDSRTSDTGRRTYLDESHQRNRRLMRRAFKASLMSDTKWRKLFLAVEKLDWRLALCRVKWIEGPNIRLLSTPGSTSLFPPRPFVEAVEFGPFELCSIEWLEFPRVAIQEGNWMGRRDGAVYEQDVERAERALRAVARFPMEQTESGLRGIGHLR